MLADKLCPNDFRNVQEALIVQDIFDILLVSIIWLLSSNLPSLVIFILEFLQLQLHQADAGLVESLACQLVLKRFPKLA